MGRRGAGRKKRKGLAARHVIASSTLGLAIERSTATLLEMQGWLKEHGKTPPTEDHKARREIWTLVHNHPGNLWMGSAPANTAIGFIRSALKGIRTEVVKKGSGGLIDRTEVQVLVKKKMVEGQDNERNRTWSFLLNELSAEIDALKRRAAPAATPTPVASGTPVVSPTPVDKVACKDVAELIGMYVRNADIDIPTLTGKEYEAIVKIWEKLKDPKQVLAALKDFMNLSLTHSIKPPKPPS